MANSTLLLRLQQMLGPGLIFAAVSIGVSHLVQSTRAGALYGLGMLGIIIMANVLKYPAFRFAPEYTAITGQTILYGFKKQGMWALLLFAFLSVPTMFAGTAAVTLVTAGILKTALGLNAEINTIVSLTLIVCPLILIIGRYHLLDIMIKVLMIVLAISTVLATILIFPSIQWDHSIKLYPSPIDLKVVLFMVALFGWMPAPIDVAVWHSLWAKAKIMDTEKQYNKQGSQFDFHLGYIGTAFMAICFMFLGFAVMYNSGTSFVESSAGFAAQFIGLYTQALGEWTTPVIKISALAVMLSTTLVILDAYPRAIAAIRQQMKTNIISETKITGKTDRSWYIGSMIVLAIGVLLIVYLFIGTFKTLVDFATTFSFLAAPILAWLIHRSIMSEDIPEEYRIHGSLRYFSIACITGLSLFAISYLYILIRV